MVDVTYLANFAMAQNEYQREIVTYKEFFWEFYTTLNQRAQNEIAKEIKLKANYFDEKRN